MVVRERESHHALSYQRRFVPRAKPDAPPIPLVDDGRIHLVDVVLGSDQHTCTIFATTRLPQISSIARRIAPAGTRIRRIVEEDPFWVSGVRLSSQISFLRKSIPERQVLI